MTIEQLVLCLFLITNPLATETYTLSLHDALPISPDRPRVPALRRHRRGGEGNPPGRKIGAPGPRTVVLVGHGADVRSEEHTSELQSRRDLVCRLLLEKKNLSVPQREVHRQPCHRP